MKTPAALTAVLWCKWVKSGWTFCCLLLLQTSGCLTIRSDQHMALSAITYHTTERLDHKHI